MTLPGPMKLRCDLIDPAAVKAAVSHAKPDWVVHLAALYVGHADQEAFYRTNVFGTLLLSALAELKSPPARVWWRAVPMSTAPWQRKH